MRMCVRMCVCACMCVFIYHKPICPRDFFIILFYFRVCVCVFVCSHLFNFLTAAPIDLIFSMHTHIRYRSVIGYMILTFDVIKGHFRSNKILCQVPVNLKGTFFILRILG